MPRRCAAAMHDDLAADQRADLARVDDLSTREMTVFRRNN